MDAHAHSYDQMVGITTVPPQGIYEESEFKLAPLGARLQVGERVFHYGWASEALSKSKLCTALADVDVEETVTVAHPIDTFKVTITAGTAILANQYADGYLYVVEGTGAGDVYRIKSHPAAASGTFVVTLYDPLRTAWVIANTDIEMRQSPYRVQESNTDMQELPVGVPLIGITSGYYAWLQTWGPCCVLIDATGSFGAPANERGEISISSNTAGAVMKPTALQHSVGQVFTHATDYDDAHYQMIKLTLDP